MEHLFEIIGSILGAMLVALITYLTPKVKAWLEARTSKEVSENTMLLIRGFVRAADQLLKADDPTGEKRNKFVIEQLEELGIVVTEAILSLIEGEVWEVNNTQLLGIVQEVIEE